MNKKRYYIAYGSNLSVEQMSYRCPDAKLFGTAILENYKLIFRHHATVEESPGSSCPVVVWEITEMDEKNLDRYESFPIYYYKKDLLIKVETFKGGKEQYVTAMLYIMNPGKPISSPIKDYFEIIESNYERFGFDKTSLYDALQKSKT